jgi:hypothetical protein
VTREQAVAEVRRIRAESAQYDMLDPDFVTLLDAAELLAKAQRWAPTGYTNADGLELYRCACCGRLTTQPHNANPTLCEPACAEWTGQPPAGVRLMGG